MQEAPNHNEIENQKHHGGIIIMAHFNGKINNYFAHCADLSDLKREYHRFSIEPGMKFVGNRNGREILILKADNTNVTYQDLKYMTVFTVGRKLFERCDLSQSCTF